MGKVMPILMIIFGLFVSGFYWHIWNDCTIYLQPYIIYDVYYSFISFIWSIIPLIILFAGVAWLIAQGVGRSADQQ